MQQYRKIVEWSSKGMLAVAGASLLASMLLVVYNAVIRNFMDPLAGTSEIAGILGMMAVTFAMAYTQQQKGNVSVTLLVDKMRPVYRKIVETLLTLITTLFFALVSFKIIEYGLELMETPTFLQTTGITMYPLMILMGIGFAGLVNQMLYQIIEGIFTLKRGDLS